jgi:hypothetical protein
VSTAKLVDIDDIALSTNGGFHVGGDAAASYEQAKLQRVEMVAATSGATNSRLISPENGQRP